jgi:predicted metal-dependent hydrolase
MILDIKEGVRLFNDSDFFAAHNFFEDLWMEANKDDKFFYQGLVQISVGCFHMICGNLSGAKSQISKGINKLLDFIPEYNKLELTILISNFEKILIDLNEINISLMREKIPILELTS